MKLKTIISPLAILFVSLALACTDANDLGQSCKLVKKGPENTAVSLTEAEVRKALSGSATGDKNATSVRDFISLGAPDCEDLACIRDSQFNPGSVSDSSDAYGYCAIRCANEGSSCKASNSKTKYTCRQLMLDPETWEQACKADASNCIDISSTLFCAREI